MNDFLPEPADGLPNISGAESAIAEAMSRTTPGSPSRNDGSSFAEARSAFAIALHMHQPLIPAGNDDLQNAPIIGNLQHMMEHPEQQDAHNAPVFLECYRRMGEFIPQLVNEGKRPRVMLDYSGCLFHGLQQMGANDVFDALKPLAQNPEYQRCVEWLGTCWGHAVAPSTPAQDFRLHVRAWQHHFASMFGLEALSRVRGFSPPEMALPNHPDVCYEFVRTLNDCGYRWLLVQEHSVEQPDGAPIRRPHVPHRLIARNSRGQCASIIAIIKTQGSDNKLVAQMQPFYEAKNLAPIELGGKNIPPLVTQIGDGENGGVMMNEFPPKFHQVIREELSATTPAMNVTEYLDHLAASGVREEHFPPIQPILQKRIWDRFETGAGPEKLEKFLTDLKCEDNRFQVEGASWTAEISWVRGYENVLGPMRQASALFSEKIIRRGVPTTDPRYRRALYHLMLAQTSCFRYWGQGRWTDYGRELCRRTVEAIGV
jgi:hypothetical protein